MPFLMKNAGSTYQRAMTFLFMIWCTKMEFYVYDIVAKTNPRRTTSQIYKWSLTEWGNMISSSTPTSPYSVQPRDKLLGFIVSQRGIEIDPSKIKAITEIPMPKIEKQVRGFLGRINYIGCFIAKLATTCEPLFKLLQKMSRWCGIMVANCLREN